MLLLFFVPAGCRGRILIGYHSVNEKWQITCEGIVYSFEYVSNTKNSVSLKIERKNEFISKNMNDGSTRIENKIFMYCDNFNRNFEYVKIDNKRIEEKTYKKFIQTRSYYEIANNNIANIFIFTWDKHFKGCVKTNIYEDEIEDGWPTHFISLALY